MSLDHDKEGLNWFTQDQLMDSLEDVGLFALLNDQQLMTLMRTCKEAPSSASSDSAPRYFYHEVCDLFSYCYCKKQAGTKKKATAQLDMLLDDLRARQTRWRRYIIEKSC